MKLRILGCAGGIGGRERLTTSLRIDDDILLDAGTGLASLDIDQLVKIDHVFLTHTHLDHVAGLALLVDAVMGKRATPVTVHSTVNNIATLKRHVFNWAVWPDFATIPDAENPILQWESLEHGVPVELGGRLITAHPVHHAVEAVGYLVGDPQARFLFTGDMATTPELWRAMKNLPSLTKVIVDCSFPNAEAALAEVSGHYCPQALVEDVRDMPESTEFLIYHLKPGQEDMIMQELTSNAGGRTFRALKCGDQFDF
ncbi:MAG: 3',5'-cyclic-nucleotide phosphodiesterase [Burkholderiaceae bacterium]|nr:3',5'-cyclic-nucleotide phosphodiesterase [Burkholderiaceae bacterium]